MAQILHTVHEPLSEFINQLYTIYIKTLSKITYKCSTGNELINTVIQVSEQLITIHNENLYIFMILFTIYPSYKYLNVMNYSYDNTKDKCYYYFGKKINSIAVSNKDMSMIDNYVLKKSDIKPGNNRLTSGSMFFVQFHTRLDLLITPLQTLTPFDNSFHNIKAEFNKFNKLINTLKENYSDKYKYEYEKLISNTQNKYKQDEYKYTALNYIYNFPLQKKILLELAQKIFFDMNKDSQMQKLMELLNKFELYNENIYNKINESKSFFKKIFTKKKNTLKNINGTVKVTNTYLPSIQSKITKTINTDLPNSNSNNGINGSNESNESNWSNVSNGRNESNGSNKVVIPLKNINKKPTKTPKTVFQRIFTKKSPSIKV